MRFLFLNLLLIFHYDYLNLLWFECWKNDSLVEVKMIDDAVLKMMNHHSHDYVCHLMNMNNQLNNFDHDLESDLSVRFHFAICNYVYLMTTKRPDTMKEVCID